MCLYQLFTTLSRLLTTLAKDFFLKTLREKKKMLVTSIFFFSHNVFNSTKDKKKNYSIFILSSANAFNLDQSKILLFGKELIDNKTVNYFICLQELSPFPVFSKACYLLAKTIRELIKYVLPLIFGHLLTTID